MSVWKDLNIPGNIPITSSDWKGMLETDCLERLEKVLPFLGYSQRNAILHRTGEYECPRILSLLVSDSEDLDYSSEVHSIIRTALSKWKSLEMIKILLSHSRIGAVSYGTIQTAIQLGRLDVVKYLSKVGLNYPFAQRRIGNNEKYLELACVAGHLDIVKFFIKEGADISFSNNQGENCFWFACEAGRLEIVKFLVEEKHVPLNLANTQGITPLVAARTKKKEEVVKYLLAKAPSIEFGFWLTTLQWNSIFKNDSLETFQKVFHFLSLSEIQNAFQCAGESSCSALISFLVSNSKFQRPQDFRAIVKQAISNWKSFELIKLLFKHKRFHRLSALFYAAQIGKLDIIDELFRSNGLKKEFELSIEDHNGNTLLANACSIGNNLDVVKFLIKEGADLSSPNIRGENCFWLACKAGRLEIVKFLVEEKHVPLNLANTQGITPLVAARTNKKEELIQYLLDKGAKDTPF